MRLGIEILERIRAALGKSVTDWADLLGVREREYRTGLLEGALSLEPRAVDELIQKLNITSDCLLSGEIPYRSLSLGDAADCDRLPEIYSHGAFSRVRTSSHLLDVLEIQHGWRLRHQVLKKLGVSERALADPDAKISIRFLAALCSQLQAQGFSEEALHDFGKYSVITNYASPLGRTFRETRNPKDMIERAFTEIINRSFDRNFLYQLVDLRETHCTVEARVNPEVLEDSKSKTIGTPLTCKTRGGAFSSIFGYLDLPYADVTETACIHRGDSQCRYEIDYEVAQWCHKTLTAG